MFLLQNQSTLIFSFDISILNVDRAARIRTGAKSSRRTRATATLQPDENGEYSPPRKFMEKY